MHAESRHHPYNIGEWQVSADNWAACPKCRNDADAAAKVARQAANDSYGKSSVDEWMELHNHALDLEAKCADFKPRNLREDYEIGVDENDLTIQYRAHCSVCKFSARFTHNEQVYP